MDLRLLRAVWKGRSGWVSVPARHGEEWIERWLEWPSDAELISEWLEEANRSSDVYFSPLVYTDPTRRTARKCVTNWAWADFDDVNPKKLDPKPTVLWQTSPGRYQGLYLLKHPVTGAEVEKINRRIAIATKSDPSGWDAGQVLRVPGSRNHKYEGAPKGKLLYVNGPKYDPADFDHIELPAEAELDDLEELPFQKTFEEWRSVLPARAIQLLETPPEQVRKGERSDQLWNLIFELAHAKIPENVIYTLAKGSVWNKFRGRSDEEERIRKEIAKAIAQRAEPIIIVHNDEEDDSDEEPVDDVSEETVRLELPKGSWLDEYIRASQLFCPGVDYIYHVVCGVSLLSVATSRLIVCSNRVARNLPPVLWFLTVGPSASGKSRTYDFMMDVFEASGLIEQIPVVDSFSPEGLVAEVADSPSRQVWLIPDEAHSLFQSMSRRDYMAGARAMLSKMADGRVIARKTVKNKTLIYDYTLNFYGTTQPEGFLKSLSAEDVNTGFLRRFFITYRPEYAPQPWQELPPNGDETIRRLANGLMEIRKSLMQLEPGMDRAEADLTTPAFRRFVAMDKKQKEQALENPVLASILSGSTNHALKLATLLAVQARPELYMGGVTVDEEIMDQAASLVEAETAKAGTLIELIGSNESERVMEDIMSWLRKRPGRKATRTEIQQRFGKRIGSKWDMDKLEATLEDRGLIEVKMEQRGRRKAKVYVATRVK